MSYKMDDFQGAYMLSDLYEMLMDIKEVKEKFSESEFNEILSLKCYDFKSDNELQTYLKEKFKDLKIEKRILENVYLPLQFIDEDTNQVVSRFELIKKFRELRKTDEEIAELTYEQFEASLMSNSGGSLTLDKDDFNVF